MLILRFDIREVNKSHVAICGVYGKYPVWLSTLLPQIMFLYLDWLQIKILSVMYLEAHFVQYTRKRKVNTAYSITVLQ